MKSSAAALFRAVRRTGKLAKMIETATGARTDLGWVPALVSCESAAAGLPPRQLKKATCVDLASR
jgi:hypothetical protein